MSIGNYSKAIVGGLASACAAAAPLLQDGHISESDGLIIAGAFLASLGVVYIVPNASSSQGHGSTSGAAAQTSTPSTAATDTAPPTPAAPATPASDDTAALPTMPAADDTTPTVQDSDATTTPPDDDDAPAVPIATGRVVQGA